MAKIKTPVYFIEKQNHPSIMKKTPTIELFFIKLNRKHNNCRRRYNLN